MKGKFKLGLGGTIGVVVLVLIGALWYTGSLPTISAGVTGPVQTTMPSGVACNLPSAPSLF